MQTKTSQNRTLGALQGVLLAPCGRGKHATQAPLRPRGSLSKKYYQSTNVLHCEDMDTTFAQVNVKGQIVIPAKLRDELKITSGTRIAVQRDGGTIVLQPVTDEFLESLRGCLKVRGRPSASKIWRRDHRRESQQESRRYGERR